MRADIGLLILRLPIGVLFAMAGLLKFRMGLREFVNKFASMIPSYLPHPVGVAYLYAVPPAELIVGLCLIFGVFARAISVITALMLISFMMAVTGWRDPQGGPFNASVVYLAIAIALALIGPGRISLDHVIGKRIRKQR